MISIYGRSSAAPAAPRKHNHFVPDGYIPPKSRQKIVSPPHRTTTPRPILKTAASSRTTTPTRSRQNYPLNSPAAHQPSSTPRRRVNSPHRPMHQPRENLTKNYVFPLNAAAGHGQMISRPQTSPADVRHNIQVMPKSILKSPSSSRKMIKPESPCPVETLKTAPSPSRVTKSASTSPHGTARSHSPARSQQGCHLDGEFARSQQGCHDLDRSHFEDYTPPASTQSKRAPMHKKVLESIHRDIPDGSYMGSPISVVDKYDERDNPIWWKPTLCHRRGPPAKSSLRPHARHPNILFDRIVNSQQGYNDACRTTSCRASSCSTSCESDNHQEFEDEDEDPPHWWHPNYEPCCPPLDWDHDAVLKSVEDRQAYRQCKLEEFLREVCVRDLHEGFGSYLIRCYAYANEELNSQSKAKHLLGYVDERGQLSSLDVWVVRLHRGTVSRLLRSGTAFSGRENELFLRMLREECVAWGSVLRRHLNATERMCDAQERNYKKILLLSQRCPMGVMQHLKRRDWR